MRLLKAMMAMVAGSVMALGGASVLAQTKQAPPAKKSTAEPAKQTPAPTKQTAPAKQTAQAPVKQAPVPSKHAAPAKQVPAPAATRAPAAKATAAPPSAPEAASTPAAQASASPDMSPGNRRDPFAALVSSKRGARQAPEVTCRAPGKGSVVIDTMRVDGLVRSGDGMIAAVRTPQGRVYFLRDGDRLCDGRVERITMEGLTLRQSSRDAFGRGVERPVNKRLFPSAGE